MNQPLITINQPLITINQPLVTINQPVSSIASEHINCGPAIPKIHQAWSVADMMTSLTWLCDEPFGYGSIPIDTFLVGWTSIYQLFWGWLGTRVLTHPHFTQGFTILQRDWLEPMIRKWF